MSAAVARLAPVEALRSAPPVRAVVFLLLWGIFFIKVPLLVALGMALAGFLALHALAEGALIDRISLLIVANMAFWLLSGFMTGALTLSMLANLSYFTNEGRIFINYVPFLLLAACGVSRRTLRFAGLQIAGMALAGLALYLVWQVKHPSVLSIGHAHNFAGFLTSHTGSGTFFAELCIFLSIYGLRTGSRWRVLLGLSMILPVFGSASRESLVALAAVLAWYLRKELSVLRVLAASVLLVGLGMLMPVIAPHAYERTSELFQFKTMEDIRAQVESATAANWEPGQDRDLSGEEFNILSRILYWGYAIRRFEDSPFLGAGFGRFNDRYVHFEGIPGVYYFGVQAQNSPATLQAHNSYLHMLAETGLFGLALLLAVWLALWRRVTVAMHQFRHDPEVGAFFEALQGLTVFLLVAALFGHALGAPIDGVPVLTLLALGVSFHRAHRQPPP